LGGEFTMDKESEALEIQGSGESLGQYLLRERNARGVSLREISETTKIGVGHLEALEGDDLEALPPRAFIIGFLRAYSSCLKIDPEEAIARYERLTAHAQATSDDATREENFEEKDNALKRVVLFVFGGILVAVLFYAVFVRDWSPKVHKIPKTSNASSVETKDGS
jgi:cytoskeletal protein RodZ